MNIIRVGGREVLTAARTYYVDPTSGSDSNDGLSSGSGAFATIQKAVDTAATLDINGKTLTIQLADDAYTGVTNLKQLLGGDAIIVGNETTPANVTVTTTIPFSATDIRNRWDIRGMTLIGSTRDISNTRSVIGWQNISFQGTANQVFVARYGYAEATGNYEVAASCTRHIWAETGAFVIIRLRTVTITGTPAWGSAFVRGNILGHVHADSMTFSGSATGKRYDVAANGVINTSGGGASYFPGDSAGSTATGGQYL